MGAGEPTVGPCVGVCVGGGDTTAVGRLVGAATGGDEGLRVGRILSALWRAAALVTKSSFKLTEEGLRVGTALGGRNDGSLVGASVGSEVGLPRGGLVRWKREGRGVG